MHRIFFIGVVLLLVVISGCKNRPAYETGAAVFQGECSKCHKLEGKGGTKGPDLTSVMYKYDEDYVRRWILDPRSIKGNSTMPPADISDPELDLVVQYLKDKGRQIR